MKVILAFVSLSLVGQCVALTCICVRHTPLVLRQCSDVKDCKGGIVKDACNCCQECAKVINETCGGDFGELGKCDKGLYCNTTSDEVPPSESIGLSKVGNMTSAVTPPRQAPVRTEGKCSIEPATTTTARPSSTTRRSSLDHRRPPSYSSGSNVGAGLFALGSAINTFGGSSNSGPSYVGSGYPVQGTNFGNPGGYNQYGGAGYPIQGTPMNNFGNTGGNNQYGGAGYPIQGTPINNYGTSGGAGYPPQGTPINNYGTSGGAGYPPQGTPINNYGTSGGAGYPPQGTPINNYGTSGGAGYPPQGTPINNYGTSGGVGYPAPQGTPINNYGTSGGAGYPPQGTPINNYGTSGGAGYPPQGTPINNYGTSGGAGYPAQGTPINNFGTSGGTNQYGGFSGPGNTAHDLNNFGTSGGKNQQAGAGVIGFSVPDTPMNNFGTTRQPVGIQSQLSYPSAPVTSNHAGSSGTFGTSAGKNQQAGVIGFSAPDTPTNNFVTTRRPAGIQSQLSYPTAPEVSNHAGSSGTFGTSAGKNQQVGVGGFSAPDTPTNNFVTTRRPAGIQSQLSYPTAVEAPITSHHAGSSSSGLSANTSSRSPSQGFYPVQRSTTSRYRPHSGLRTTQRVSRTTQRSHSQGFYPAQRATTARYRGSQSSGQRATSKPRRH